MTWWDDRVRGTCCRRPNTRGRAAVAGHVGATGWLSRAVGPWNWVRPSFTPHRVLHTDYGLLPLLRRTQFQKSLQQPDAGGMAHFSQRLGLDLPDPFARDAELLADLFQRARIAIAHAEPQFQHAALAFAQPGQHMTQLVFENAEARRVGRILG